MKYRVEERMDIGRRIYNDEMSCQGAADLCEFPTKAAKEPASPLKTTEAEEIPLF